MLSWRVVGDAAKLHLYFHSRSTTLTALVPRALRVVLLRRVADIF